MLKTHLYRIAELFTWDHDSCSEGLLGCNVEDVQRRHMHWCLLGLPGLPQTCAHHCPYGQVLYCRLWSSTRIFNTQCNLNETGVAIVKQVSIILRGQTEAVEWWEQRNRDWRLWPRGARHCGQLHVRHWHPQPGMRLKLVHNSKFSS